VVQGVALTRKQAAISGFAWGAIAGAALVALMYFAGAVFGLHPLPQLLNEPLLSLMPGFVFGFLIDTLQHAGKVVEELGLVLAMVIGLGVLGAASAVAQLRWESQYVPFAFAGAGWLVVVAILLPLSGQGFLGLAGGPATPIVWAALFAICAVVLQYGGQAPPAFDGGRRRVLSAVPIGIGAVSVAALAYELLPGWYKAVFEAPGAGLTGATSAVTPASDFYVVSKNFVDPVVDGKSWQLRVGGMVMNPVTMTLDYLRSLPATTEYITLECISNDVGGPQISTGVFTGVKLTDLLERVSPQPGASWVGFKASDGYTESLALSALRDYPETLVAYDLNGAPLPTSHGYPARIVIPGHYGMKGPKWLESIELGTQETRGYWEQQGWDHNALVKTTSRIDTPRDGDILHLGSIDIAGVAFAGTRGIRRVEYSTDGGSTWTEASMDAPLSALTWVLWHATWTPGREGAYGLAVRATDGTGSVQTSGSAPSYPSGSSGYHAIGVNVAK
jgi:DMSO/TMAO reductase YedYZ molybdopterin-dependent catalytic subunit